MKKILSVLLAVMMLFGVLAMTASAENFDMGYSKAASCLRSEVGLGADEVFGRTEGQFVLVYFNTGGFATNSLVGMYDADAGCTVVQNPGYEGNFWLVPDDPTSSYFIGQNGRIPLPRMLGNEVQSFEGWRCLANGQSYVAGQTISITLDMVNNLGVVEFEPIAGYAQPEEDTMGTILGILIKVFGSIIGLLFCNGDVVAGQEMVSGILGGIVG